MIAGRILALAVFIICILGSGCGVKLDAEKNLTDLANVTLKKDGGVMYCLIEPRAKIPGNHFIIFRCYRGDKLLWKSGYQVKHLADQFKGKKIWTCTVIGTTSAVKAKEIKRVKVSLSPYLPYG